DDAQRFAQAWVKKDQSTGPWEFEYRIRSADGRLHNIHSRGVRMADDRGDPQGWIGVNFDITDSKRSLNRLSFLAEAGRLLASSLDPDTTLDRIATLCVPQLADWCTIEILDEDGTLKPLALKHTDPAKVEWARALQARYPSSPNDANGAYQVVRTGEPLLLKTIPDEKLVAAARD